MKTLQTDVAVIGAGSAGMTAYAAARKAGARVLLIEDGAYGTTCIRVGCMPSKLLISAGEVAQAARYADRFGIQVGPVTVDGRAVMARVRREREHFLGYVLRRIDAMPAADRIRGHARFIGPHTLQVDDALRIEARAVVLATGSEPHLPEAYRGLGERAISSDAIFEWETLPGSVVVVGPGIIGLELGQALAHLGVRVLMLGRGGRVGPITDPAVRERAIELFNRDFQLLPAGMPGEARLENGKVRIEYVDGAGSRQSGHFDYLLSATGRRPRLQGLALQHAGVSVDAHGKPQFDPATLQCRCDGSASPVFIAGDANEQRPLLHEAIDDGRIAGANAARLALGGEPSAPARRAPLVVVFSDPQIAIVGGGYRAHQASAPAVGEVSFSNQGRARIMGANAGLLRVYGDPASGRFLGAEMLGPRAEHIGHLLAWALQCQLSVAGMLDMPFYHPVVEEGLRTALQDLQRNLQNARLQQTAAS
ncbi:MAG: dihydrolipoyl dehydrogenase [Rhodocyclaceae bacterium]|nr:dihydrolipoyl dehydrogenase [Rhodocyclaceae bacterium]